MKLALDDPDLRDPYDHTIPLPRAIPILRKAYQQAKSKQFEQAISSLEPLLSSPLGRSQRRRALYILGMSHVRLFQDRDAIPFLDEAIELTNMDRDIGDGMALSLLEATAHHQLQSFASSAQYYRGALSALRSPALALDPDDRIYELEILAGLAQQFFYLGKLPESARVLRAARRVVLPSKGSQLKRAAVEWTAALVERWEGHPLTALEHAEMALPIYQQYASHNEIGRLHTVLADIHLDLASRGVEAATSGSRQMNIQLAYTHVTEALIAGRLAGDPTAEGMTHLAYTRLHRLTHPGEDASQLVESVIHTALQVKDRPLLGQGYTALARSLEDMGDNGSAQDIYALALQEFASTDIPVLGIEAWRALMRMREPHNN